MLDYQSKNTAEKKIDTKIESSMTEKLKLRENQHLNNNKNWQEKSLNFQFNGYGFLRKNAKILLPVCYSTIQKASQRTLKNLIYKR